MEKSSLGFVWDLKEIKVRSFFIQAGFSEFYIVFLNMNNNVLFVSFKEWKRRGFG